MFGGITIRVFNYAFYRCKFDKQHLPCKCYIFTSIRGELHV